MASPAWLELRAEARPSGGETLKVLLFFNLFQPLKLRLLPGQRLQNIPKYAAAP